MPRQLRAVFPRFPFSYTPSLSPSSPHARIQHPRPLAALPPRPAVSSRAAARPADGWTPQRQALFIGNLAETGSVAEAARRVGMSRVAAYRLRRGPENGSFVHAWDAVAAVWQGDLQPARKVTFTELYRLAIEGPFHGAGCGAGNSSAHSASPAIPRRCAISGGSGASACVCAGGAQ